MSVLQKMFPCPTWKRDVTLACFSDLFYGSKSASDFCFRTGAVGLPLPGVEVRIAMNNAANTTIVEGNQKETQVNDEYCCCLNQAIFFFFFFCFHFITSSWFHILSNFATWMPLTEKQMCRVEV